MEPTCNLINKPRDSSPSSSSNQITSEFDPGDQGSFKKPTKVLAKSMDRSGGTEVAAKSNVSGRGRRL